MAFNQYYTEVKLFTGNFLKAVRISGQDYILTGSGVPLDPYNTNIAADVQTALDGLYPNLFLVEVVDSGFVISVSTVCTETTPEYVQVIGDIREVDNFAPTACTSVIYDLVLSISCSAPDCVNVKDQTGDYSASNVHGYGPPNYPAISDIDHIEFVLYDADGNVLGTYANSGYLPNAAGTSEICITADKFLNDSGTAPLSEFVLGASYTLEYVIVLDTGDEITGITADFLFPCCGQLPTSNLGTNYAVEELKGCSSMNFTDTTGTYNADTNPGGYGGPNPDYSDITNTVIEITLADGTVVTFTDFIPTADNPTYNITATDLGYTDNVLLPQVLTIVYSVYMAGVCRFGYKSDYVLLHCALYECIINRSKILLNNECVTPCCDNGKEVDAILALKMRYDAMLIAAETNIACVTDEVGILYKNCKKDCATC